MSPIKTLFNDEQVVQSTESTTTSKSVIPIAERERKPSQTSEDYESGTTDSLDNERLSTQEGHELSNKNALHVVESNRANTLTKYTTGLSVVTTTDPNFEIDFLDDDPDNPRNWPMWYRCIIIFMISYSTLTVVMYSTSYTSAIPGIMSSFNIDNETIPVLGITTYMIGLALGSVVLAPLSEMYGRRPIYLVAMAMFCLLTIPCALAPNLEAILITRFFGAIAGSALISNSPGTVNDIVTEEYRALAFSLWSIGPMNGPVVGPLVGGFVFENLGWRWTNWIICILSGVGFAMLLCIKETYAPAILRKKVMVRKKETDDGRWWCRYDDKKDFWPLLRLNLSRPFIMTIKEPICIFWDIYIALLYAILYLCFVAYPIVFSDLRGWSPGITGLAYMGIGIGSLICIASEPAIRKMINSHKPDPATGRPPPESMVSIVCIGAITVPIGEMIFAWTCTPNVHWIVPILAGIPFGFGNTSVFIYASNYLVHSYGIYAASALAGNSVFRSLVGGTLPLAGPSLYRSLGPHYAGTLLSCLEFLCVPIPFVFYRYGHKIRMKSTLIRQMQEDMDRLDAKKRKNEERIARDRSRAGTAISEKVPVHEIEAELERVVSKAEKELVV
ncbi:uncharacterized protein PV09_08275 [Verruconis gallopava]|uniref:Major facilitator superfamily (MFS) profile domain-containing protein n=1 Tax=Verruconis gallopava TaxID=253628 RepID=A0A0D2ALU9_9PEZI|nr:uncharacterized protein PV09_08275 [Verruconis gallopava]KIW00089.1 hypothetical protein PV09_08275 [Verruconis gallopava]